jgi:uncharacterized membrane protein
MVQGKNNNTRNMVITSMLAALIFVFTYFIYFPVTSLGAYMNFGDCVIYSAGIIIGPPWAAAAAAIGSAVADMVHGSFIYVPATIIIKGLMGFLCAMLLNRKGFRNSGDSGLLNKNGGQKNGAGFFMFMVISVIGGAIMVVGYGIYEMLFLGGWGYVAGTIIPNLIQWGVGIAGAAALYYPVKRVKGMIK